MSRILYIINPGASGGQGKLIWDRFHSMWPDDIDPGDVIISNAPGHAREIAASGHPIQGPAVIVVGGETTVTVTGSGRGGRNQELGLSAASRIEGLKVVIATLATDGIDGPTDAAGALVDGLTAARARALGLLPVKFLQNNDSYQFFDRLGDTILTGPTGTNVNDLTLILVP